MRQPTPRRARADRQPGPPVKVFDFFSGCGGASRGFQDAGMEVAFGLDSDPDAGGVG